MPPDAPATPDVLLQSIGPGRPTRVTGRFCTQTSRRYSRKQGTPSGASGPLVGARAMPPALIAEKPSYSRGPDGRTPFGVARFQTKMCAVTTPLPPSITR